MLSCSSVDTFTARYSFVPPKTLPDVTRHWRAASEATASKIVPGIMPDSKLLLILACLFASCELPLNVLFLGATPRKRWTEQAEIGEVAASCVGLAPDLETFLSDVSRLRRAAEELRKASAIAKTSDDRYALDSTIRARVLAKLPPEIHRFWRHQALIIAYRSVPWKYLEPPYVCKSLVACIDAYFLQVVRAERAACAAP